MSHPVNVINNIASRVPGPVRVLLVLLALVLLMVALGVACGSSTETANKATPTATTEPAATALVPTVTLERSTPEALITAVASGPRVNEGANLRAGPGTNYAKVGGVKAGTALEVLGRSAAGDWLQLADGAWIAAFLVDDAPTDLPVVAAPEVSAAPAAPLPLLATAAPAVEPAGSSGAAHPGAFTCVGGCAVAPDPACAIKGNVNSQGEKIFHAPGQRDYERTDIKPEEGDRWFCSADEARAAGFRQAQR